jgi:hypothetical protein
MGEVLDVHLAESWVGEMAEVVQLFDQLGDAELELFVGDGFGCHFLLL